MINVYDIISFVHFPCIHFTDDKQTREDVIHDPRLHEQIRKLQYAFDKLNDEVALEEHDAEPEPDNLGEPEKLPEPGHN